MIRNFGLSLYKVYYSLRAVKNRVGAAGRKKHDTDNKISVRRVFS